MKKRIISILLTFVLLISFALSAACGVKETDVNGTELSEETLSREQWIIGLGAVFGMNEYTTEEPFFSDVDSLAEVYPYLQSCAEWGIFEKTGDAFRPEEPVTREYAVQTAVMAAEVLGTSTDENAYEECIPYAMEHGIIDSDKEDYLSEAITYAQGQEILDWAVAEYQNREFVEYSNVEVNEEVIDISDREIVVSENGDTATILDENVEELQIGDVFIAPGTTESPEGVAMKVTDINYDENGNQVLETAEPELEELFKELDFAVRVIPDADDVIVSEGVTLASTEQNSMVYADYTMNDPYDAIKMQNAVGGNDGNIVVGNGANFGFKVNFTKGKPTFSSGWKSSMDNLKLDMQEWDSPDQEKIGKLFEQSSAIYLKNGDKPEIKVADNKFEGGYEITGELKIQNLCIDIESETEKKAGIPVGIKKFYINTNYDVISSLSIKGTLEEELTVATFSVPTTIPGMTVNIKVSLYVDANGELQVKFTASNNTSMGWSDGRLKNVSECSSVADEVSMAIEIEPGVAVRATPIILGLKIIDVKVKAGVKYKFSSNVEEKISMEDNVETCEYIWSLTGKVTYPLVKLSIGTDKEAKYLLENIKFSYDIVGENAPIKASTYEFFNESYSLGVIKGEELETEATEETELIEDTEEAILNDSEILDLEVYMLALNTGDTATIKVTSVPEGYSTSDLRWESDNTDVAVVKGESVTAVGEGTAQIKVATSDGKYQIYCTIIVSDNEEVEFHSL